MHIILSNDSLKNYKSVYSLIDNIVVSPEFSIIIDMEQIQLISLNMMRNFTYLVFLLYNNFGIKILIVNPTENLLTFLPRYSGITSFIEVNVDNIILSPPLYESHALSINDFPYTRINYVSNLYEHSRHYEEMVSLLNTWYPSNTKSINSFKILVKELTANAAEHSTGLSTGSPDFNGSYMDLIWKEPINSNTDIFHYQIYDKGVGIRYNIENTYGPLSSEDFFYIGYAIKPGITSRTFISNGGLGLSSILNEIKKLHSNFSIHSGTGKYVLSSIGNEDLVKTEEFVRGTIINLSIIIKSVDML